MSLKLKITKILRYIYTKHIHHKQYIKFYYSLLATFPAAEMHHRNADIAELSSDPFHVLLGHVCVPACGLLMQQQCYIHGCILYIGMAFDCHESSYESSNDH